MEDRRENIFVPLCCSQLAVLLLLLVTMSFAVWHTRPFPPSMQSHLKYGTLTFGLAHIKTQSNLQSIFLSLY